MNNRKKTDKKSFEKTFKKNWIRVKATIDRERNNYYLRFRFIDNVEMSKDRWIKSNERFCKDLGFIKRYADYYFDKYFTI